MVWSVIRGDRWPQYCTDLLKVARNYSGSERHVLEQFCWGAEEFRVDHVHRVRRHQNVASLQESCTLLLRHAPAIDHTRRKIVLLNCTPNEMLVASFADKQELGRRVGCADFWKGFCEDV